MANRKTTVKPIFNMKISELPAVALIYHAILSIAGELDPFTSKDNSINRIWLDGFKISISNVKNIVPAKTIIKETKNLTSKIKTNSKQSVLLGNELTYWLNKTFENKLGTIDSFPIIEANDIMRSGDTEGLVEHLNTILEQITAHETELTTEGYPLTNKNEYQTLHDMIQDLNTEQELQKMLVPDHTDKATIIRNTCYIHIKTILDINNFLYKNSNPEKYRSFLRSTIINRMRATRTKKT